MTTTRGHRAISIGGAAALSVGVLVAAPRGDIATAELLPKPQESSVVNAASAANGVRGSSTHPRTWRVSVASGGAQVGGANGVRGVSISARGRFVAFISTATTLVPDDTNGARDVFVNDHATLVTERVSVATGGAQSNRLSIGAPSISAHGRFVAFTTGATNLVPGDTNRSKDIFVRDRLNDVTQRVSVGPAGAQTNDDSRNPVISGDGRFVAFTSHATNLVPDDTNGESDLFVHDRQTHVTERVSVGSGGAEADQATLLTAAISAHGHYIAFTSFASNLVATDTNTTPDVFVRDLGANTTELVSVDRAGRPKPGYIEFGPSISAHGRYVAFETGAQLVPRDTDDEPDVYVRDRVSETVIRASIGRGGVQSNGSSYDAQISADGRSVAFESEASNLVFGDTNDNDDIYVRDLAAHKTQLASVRSDGRLMKLPSHDPAISADGRFVAFDSPAILVPDDTNHARDVFVRRFG